MKVDAEVDLEMTVLEWRTLVNAIVLISCEMTGLTAQIERSTGRDFRVSLMDSQRRGAADCTDDTSVHSLISCLGGYWRILK